MKNSDLGTIICMLMEQVVPPRSCVFHRSKRKSWEYGILHDNPRELSGESCYQQQAVQSNQEEKG